MRNFSDHIKPRLCPKLKKKRPSLEVFTEDQKGIEILCYHGAVGEKPNHKHSRRPLNKREKRIQERFENI